MAELQGKVEALLITPGSLPGKLVDEVEVQWEGFVGDKHFGLTMEAGSSQKPYPKGAQVRNVRQISIVSQEELSDIAEALQIPRLEPDWVGANMLVSGIPDLTRLPAGSRFYFEQGVGIVVEGENMPCTTAGGSLQSQYPERPEITTIFPKKAIGKRGLVAWVERPGVILKGESVMVRLANDVRS
ncbi:MAG: MOSC domain-containing protein [Anaerolineales bacterium]